MTLRHGDLILGVIVFLLARAVECLDPQVTVLNGTYAGLHSPAFQQDLFLGMPYAQDTGGENRFRIPQALNESWQDVRSAKQYGNACPDENMAADAVYGMSENCLSLNVVRPTGINATANVPVLVWIHGGRQVDCPCLTWCTLRSDSKSS